MKRGQVHTKGLVGVYAFSMFMLYPLIQQYVYRRLWQQLTGAPYPTQMNYTHCSDKQHNVSSIHQVGEGGGLKPV
uniref:Uncharacterized protein n=1 Tax=Oncorhynchus kisutch TaxID=8019 RepID=A0A8C7MQH5_ONCKI